MHNCWLAAPYQPLCHLCCFQFRLCLGLASRLLPDAGAASARLSECRLLHTLHMPTRAPWLPADKQKREVYDRFGEEGLKGGMPPAGGGMPGGMGAGGMPGGMPQGFRFNPRSAEDIFAEVGPGSHLCRHAAQGCAAARNAAQHHTWAGACLGRGRWGTPGKAGLGAATISRAGSIQELKLCTMLQPLGWAEHLVARRMQHSRARSCLLGNCSREAHMHCLQLCHV